MIGYIYPNNHYHFEGNLMDYKTVPISDVVPRGVQVRQNFESDFIKGLSASLKEDGLLCPLLVRQDGEKFEIVAGEQRYRAAKLAKMKEIPVVVIDADDKKAIELAFKENIYRKDLSSKEREDAVAFMWESGEYKSEVELAKAIGVGKQWVGELLSSRKDRSKLELTSDVSTKIITSTESLDDTSRKELIKATQKGQITKEAHVVGKIASAIKQAPEKARPRIVKAIAEQEIPMEDVAGIAEAAENEAEVEDLLKAKRTMTPREYKGTVDFVKKEKAGGRKPVLKTITTGDAPKWSLYVGTLEDARDTLILLNPKNAKGFDVEHRKKAKALCYDIIDRANAILKVMGE